LEADEDDDLSKPKPVCPLPANEVDPTITAKVPFRSFPVPRSPTGSPQKEIPKPDFSGIKTAGPSKLSTPGHPPSPEVVRGDFSPPLPDDDIPPPTDNMTDIPPPKFDNEPPARNPRRSAPRRSTPRRTGPTLREFERKYDIISDGDEAPVVQVPSEGDGDADGDLPIALRRRKRVKVKPLRFWLGEKIVYGCEQDGSRGFEYIHRPKPSQKNK
jgi:hypothetical protein